MEKKTDFTLLGRDMHGYVMRFLSLKDQIHLSMTCSTLRRNARAQLYQSTIGLPYLTDVIHHSPIFKRVKLSYENIAHIIRCAGPFLQNMIDSDSQCAWKLLALCGLEQELKDELKEQFYTIEDCFGYSVAEYFALGGQLECMRRFLAYRFPNFVQAQHDPDHRLTCTAAQGGHKHVLECLQKDYGYSLTASITGVSLQTPKFTLLSFALQSGNDATIEFLLSEGAKPAECENPAMRAAQFGNWRWYEYFNKIQRAVTDKKAAIELAGYMAKYGKLDELDIIIKQYSIETSLLVKSAFEMNNDKIINQFLERGWLDYAMRTADDISVLHMIANLGHLDLLISVLEDPRCPYNVKTLDKEGRACIHYAALGGKWALTEYLLKNYYLDCEVPTTAKGQNLAHLAAINGHVWYLKYLHKKHPEYFTQSDNEGASVLHSACYQLNTDVIRFLIDELGADLDAENNNQQTPLQYLVLIIQLKDLNDYSSLWQAAANIVHHYQRYDLLDQEDAFGETMQNIIDDSNVTALFLPAPGFGAANN